MKGILFALVVVCFGLSAVANTLEINVNPMNPILITAANSGGPHAPYFSISNLDVFWTGTQAFELLAIDIKGPGINCGMSGVASSALFALANIYDCKGNVVQSPAVGPNGELIFPAASPACSVSATSTGFFCDQLKVPVQPNPMSSYNIPAEVTVYGQIVSHGGQTQKVIGMKKIVIQ